MAFWRKKQPQPEPTPVPEKTCNHKYQDFPWYLTWNISPSSYHITVKEPYVCIYCGNRINKLLSEYKGGNGGNEGNRLLKELRETFKDKIEPQEIVEDKINDMVLVDEEYLKWYRLLRSSPSPIKLHC